MTTHVAIVYHSGYGHTAAVAEHVAKGAGEVPGVEASLFKAENLADSGTGPARRRPAWHGTEPTSSECRSVP